MTKRSHRRKPGDPRVAIAYIRVSTDRERQELGAEGQRAAIEQWAQREGVTVAAWFIEELSGDLPLDKRRVLLEAIAAVEAHGAGRLVFQRWDRFSREPVTVALAKLQVERAGAALISADGLGNGDDPAAQLIRDVVLAVARFEKALIRARIKTALAVKKQRGEMTGAPPFGWRVGGDGKTLELDPVESAVRNEVRALRASGLTVRSLTTEASARGLRGRAGKPLTQTAVFKMVRDLAAA